MHTESATRNSELAAQLRRLKAERSDSLREQGLPSSTATHWDREISAIEKELFA